MLGFLKPFFTLFNQAYSLLDFSPKHKDALIYSSPVCAGASSVLNIVSRLMPGSPLVSCGRLPVYLMATWPDLCNSLFHFSSKSENMTTRTIGTFKPAEGKPVGTAPKVEISRARSASGAQASIALLRTIAYAN